MVLVLDYETFHFYSCDYSITNNNLTKYKPTANNWKYSSHCMQLFCKCFESSVSKVSGPGSDILDLQNTEVGLKFLAGLASLFSTTYSLNCDRGAMSRHN